MIGQASPGFGPFNMPWLLDLFVAIILALWLGAAFAIVRLLREEPDARRELWGLTAWAFALVAWRGLIPAHFFASVSASFPDHTSKIGLGWPSLVAALSHLAPRTDLVSFGAARLCGVLTGPVAYTTLRRLSGDRRVALLGAGLLVALPFQIMLAIGDDAHPAALLLFLAGMSHFTDYARTGQRRAFALAAPCLVLMVHTRLETGFLLFSILALVAQPKAFAALLRRDARMLSMAGIATVVFTQAAISSDMERCLPYPPPAAVLREAINAVTLFPAMGDHFTKDMLLGVVPDFETTNFDDISWVPIALLPLLWSGWGMLLSSKAGWRMLLAVLIARVPGYAYLGVAGTDYLGSRHFVGVLPLLCMVTAVGAVAIGERLRFVALPVALGFAALFFVESRAPLRFRFAFQEEYTFLRRAIATLPENASIAHLPFEFGLSPAESSLRLRRPDILWSDFNREDSPNTRFAYLGPDCDALQRTDIEGSTHGYLHPDERLALLTHLRERCQSFTRLPTRRVLLRGTVSRHGHGPPITEGPRLPVALIELDPMPDAVPDAR